MAVYKRDMVDINLETGNIHRSFLKHSIGKADSAADHFGVRVFRNGEAVSLTGVSVQGYFRDPQGNNIAITSGNIVSGNEAEVVLPQACYNYEGQFCLAVKLIGGGVTGTVRIVDGMVDNTNTGSAVAPTETVPTYQEILAVYGDMQETLEEYDEVVAEQNDHIAEAIGAIIDGDRVVNSWENGSWSNSGPSLTSNNKRIRPSTFIDVRVGDIVTITNGSYKHAVGIWKGTLSSNTNLRNDGSFSASNETITITDDGFFIVAFADAQDTTAVVDPANFDGGISVSSYAKRTCERLKKDIYTQEEITTSILYGGNLIGAEYGKMYPVYIPLGSEITFAISEGVFVTPATWLRTYNKDGELITFYSTSVVTGQSQRTITITGEDVYYLQLANNEPAKPWMVQFGDKYTGYVPYDESNPYVITKKVKDVYDIVYKKQVTEFGNYSWRNSDGMLVPNEKRVGLKERVFIPRGIHVLLTKEINNTWYSWSTWRQDSTVQSGYVLIQDSNTKYSETSFFSFDTDVWLMVTSGRDDNADIDAATVHPFGLSYSVNDSLFAITQKVNGAKSFDFGELVKAGQLISHRCKPFPEDTLEGLLLCIKTNGIRVHELDVAFTSDNVAVLLHDTTINRTGRNPDGTAISSTINISDITYQQALQYDFGIYKGQEYAGIKIPKLEDVLITLRRYNCAAIIDILGHSYTGAQYGIMHDLFVGTRMLNCVAINGDSTKLNAYSSLYTDTPLNPSASTNSATTVQNAVDSFGNKCPLLLLSGYIEDATDTSASFFMSIHEKGAIAMLGMTSDVDEVNDLFNAGCDLVYSETLKNSDVQ